jgi:hypothetical protein
MFVRSDRLASLASPAFIAALTLLVLNDFALKPLLHNAFTGKLSDFAGLFALTLFVATLWPRHRWAASCAIAAAFTFWKTSHAEPLIEWLNVIMPFAVGRTVDLTDLAALPVIPLAVWAGPRLASWPLPRLLQLALVVAAVVAFTATSRARYAARSTMDVTQQASVADPAVLQGFFDEIADELGLRCEVCVPLSEGRVYVAKEDSNVRALVVKLDGRQTLDVTASGYDRERGVRVLARRIRSEIEERFPAITVVGSAIGPLYAVPVEGETTIFVVRVSSEADAERAQGTLTSIVDDVARSHGLAVDADDASRYHFGDSVEPEYSSFLIVADVGEPGMLLVRVISRYADRDELQRGVADQLAARLVAAFGAENVTRHVTAPVPLQWVY